MSPGPGQEEAMESAALVSWQRCVRGSPRVGVSPLSTDPQGAPPPLTTRAGQKSRTKAVVDERDV